MGEVVCEGEARVGEDQLVVREFAEWDGEEKAEAGVGESEGFEWDLRGGGDEEEVDLG